MDGKFVAIKMHFGELGNISYLRPNYAKAVVDVIKELGGKPFLTRLQLRCVQAAARMRSSTWNAPGKRIYPVDCWMSNHHRDGLKGTDDIAVPVAGGEYIKEAKIGRASWTPMSLSA